eukprot:CAMPEP_0172491048 /NCGR_PEP_ID=MMETSP1066-20121228/21727_1 /TAXON_ID=671091 /ORGANISM="Coscinodiscus wailesii, Strain CCMP2513" /LENGTH=378 /DNA_ID=CAMNT_0013259869 /DNA_START=71 /DNA_END=1204 /DNA_ORIENTATION=-
MSNYDDMSILTETTASLSTYQTSINPSRKKQTKSTTNKGKKIKYDNITQAQSTTASAIDEYDAPGDKISHGYTIKPDIWIEPEEDHNEDIYIGRKESHRRSCSPKKIAFVILLCVTVISLASAAIFYVARFRPSIRTHDIDNDNDDNVGLAPPSDPHMTTRNFVQRLSGPLLQDMSILQIQNFQQVLARYTHYYAASGGEGDSGYVTTTCDVQKQTLFSKTSRKRKQTGGARALLREESSNAINNLTKTLEVRFSMIYASSVTDVISEEYPAWFMKFINTDTGKALELSDLRTTVGLSVDSISDVVEEDDYETVTESPTVSPTTPFPTMTPTVMRSIIPTWSPTPGPTNRPTHRPTAPPTRRPTAAPTPCPPEEDNSW